jgi:hypothetical protein
MNDFVLAKSNGGLARLKASCWTASLHRLQKGVYNLGLDEFIEWYGQQPRPGFTKATVNAWRGALEARRLGAVSINVRITAVRRLAVQATDNGLLAPELAAHHPRERHQIQGRSYRQLAVAPAGARAFLD